MGDSGCGKSTLLRHMIGLKRPAQGSVYFGSESLWDASPEERARRRCQEKLDRGESAYYSEVLEATRRRDRIDSTRAAAPLKAADDAVILPTDDLDVDGVVEAIREVIAGREMA